MPGDGIYPYCPWLEPWGCEPTAEAAGGDGDAESEELAIGRTVRIADIAPAEDAAYEPPF